MNVEKNCISCGQTKSVELFSTNRKMRHGKSNLCLDCSRAKSRAYYQQHKDTIKARAKEYVYRNYSEYKKGGKYYKYQPKKDQIIDRVNQDIAEIEGILSDE